MQFMDLREYQQGEFIEFFLAIFMLCINMLYFTISIPHVSIFI